MKLKNFLPGLIFLIIAMVMVYVNDLEDKPNFFPSMAGKEVPIFATESLKGEKVTQDLLKGKIVNFWASWCTACRAEHDYLLNIQDKGYELVGVNSGDRRDAGLEYLKEHKDPFIKNVYDPRRTLAIAMGVTGMPETFIVNDEGIIIYHHRGVLTRNEIFNELLPAADELNKK